MPSWVQDPKTGKLIPKELYQREETQRVLIQGDIEPFISPIDGTTITSRSVLREHNRKHGVTNMRDYGENWFKRKAEERRAELRFETAAAKQERIAALNEAIEKHRG
jgi:hypothetical protein